MLAVVLENNGKRSSGVEGHFAGQQLVQDYSKTVHVRTRIQLFSAALLGRHIVSGSNNRAFLRKVYRFRACLQLGDAKVQHLNVLDSLLRLNEPYIVGLQIAVNNPSGVRGG